MVQRFIAPAFMALAALALADAAPASAEPTQWLKVPGFRPSLVVTPSRPGPRPVLVALHGNFDRAQWNCDVLPRLVRGRAWLLCLRGIPRRDTPRSMNRWTYGARSRVLAELDAALAALRARHGARVAPGPVTLAGFSLGAIYAARFAVRRPKQFRRLYLVEGSHKVWTTRNRRRFARKGGEAILFGCGRKGCGRWSRRLCKAFKTAGVHCGEVTVAGLGHSYTEPLPSRASPLFEQLLASDPRWK